MAHHHGVSQGRHHSQRQECVSRDVSVGALDEQPDFDVVGDSAHTADAFEDSLSCQLTGITIYEPGERYNAVLDGDPNGTGVHFRIPVQLTDDSIP